MMASEDDVERALRILMSAIKGDTMTLIMGLIPKGQFNTYDLGTCSVQVQSHGMEAFGLAIIAYPVENPTS